MSSTEIKSTKSPFLFLACELPPPPLFQDAVEGKNIIPQVSIYQVLSKYDGMNAQEYAGQVKRFKCQRLPPYIILHFKRFTKNFFVEEKNPTIVNFPLKGLDFKDCKCIRLLLYSRPPSSLHYDIAVVDVPADAASVPTTYDLLANITHESNAGTTRDKANTAWKVTLRAPSQPGEEENWIGIQDLIVEKVQKEIIFLGETVLQIWERSDLVRASSKSKVAKMDVDA
jgi:U4/U6.U5 tri-snRNP-associated protein 2